MKNEQSIINDVQSELIEKILTFEITKGQSPERLDVFLSRTVHNASRAKVAKAIETGDVKVNDKPSKPGRKIKPGDIIVCRLLKPPPIELIPEYFTLDIKYEDDYLLVVNKQAGMVTHPGFGNRSGTLVNALLYHLGYRENIKIETEDESGDDIEEGKIFASEIVRPGLVHRLDKDTSGLIVIAKQPDIQTNLSFQFMNRTVLKEYVAIAWGIFKEKSGTIESNIARSPSSRKLYSVVKKGGKNAITDYEVIEEFEYLSMVKIKLRTGRTHQIRVHLASLSHPILGDFDYGRNHIMYGSHNKKFISIVKKCYEITDRHMLHAKTLGFIHPVLKNDIKIETELPQDMIEIIKTLKNFSQN